MMSLGTYLEDFGLRLSEGHDGRQGGGGQHCTPFHREAYNLYCYRLSAPMIDSEQQNKDDLEDSK